jgi:hypothetical protein
MIQTMYAHVNKWIIKKNLTIAKGIDIKKRQRNKKPENKEKKTLRVKHFNIVNSTIIVYHILKQSLRHLTLICIVFYNIRFVMPGKSTLSMLSYTFTHLFLIFMPFC